MTSGTVLRRRHLIAYLALFVYLTFLGGTLYSDSHLLLRVFHQVAVTLMLGGWLVYLLRSGEGLPATGLELPLLIFMGLRFLSAWSGINPRMSLELFWRPATHVIGFYWLVWYFRRRGWTTLLRVLYLTAGVVCVVGLIEFTGWYFGLPFLPVFQQGWLQVAGMSDPFPPVQWRLNFTLSNATSLSAYLSLLTPPALAMALRARHRDGRVAWWGWVGMALVVQFLTRSRGGLLALAVSLPLFALGAAGAYGVTLAAVVGRLRRRRTVWTAGGLLLGLCLAAAVLLPPYLERKSTLTIRTELWRSALAMIADYPLLGVGNGIYGQALRSYLSVHSASYEHFTTAHNVYLNVAAESGLLALAALIWLMSVLLLIGRRRWQQAGTRQERLLVAGMGAALIGFGANSLVDTLPATALVLPVLFLAAWIIAPTAAASRRGRVLARIALALMVVYAAGLLWVDRAQWHFERSLQAARAGEWEVALEQIESARQMDSEMGLYDAQRAYYLGVVARDAPAQYLEPALAAAIQVVALDDTNSVHHANLAALHWQAGKWEAALAALARAEEINPPDPVYQLNRGMILEEAGRPGEAVQSYAIALSRAPRWAGSEFWRASSFRQEHWDDIMSAAAERANDPGGLWLAAGAPEVAEPVAAAQLADSPDRAGGYVALGLALMELGQVDRARSALDQAVAVCPECAEAYVARANWHWQAGESETASRDARVALFISPFRGAAAYHVLAKVAEAQGDVAGMERHLLQAIPPQFDSQNWEMALYGRRALLLRLPQLVTIGGGPAVARPWLELADLYLEQGRTAEAINVYRLLMARDPFLEEAGRRLAELTA